MSRIGKDNSNWKGGKTKRKCQECGKIFCSYINKSHKGKYCSIECRDKNKKLNSNPNYKGGKVRLTCIVCGKTYLRGIAESKRNSRFCSISCKSVWVIKYKVRTKDTDIEIILEEWLNDNHIPFEKQKMIAGRTVVDFFIPPNICLYADGDYWHSLPDHKKKDDEMNILLPKLGYVVLRLLGSEIKNGKRPKL